MSQSPESKSRGRWWRAVIETSAAAVAIHYAAPWKPARPTDSDARAV